MGMSSFEAMGDPPAEPRPLLQGGAIAASLMSLPARAHLPSIHAVGTGAHWLSSPYPAAHSSTSFCIRLSPQSPMQQQSGVMASAHPSGHHAAADHLSLEHPSLTRNAANPACKRCMVLLHT